MNCSELHEVMFECIERSLASPARAAAEAHLAVCENCRQNVARHNHLHQSFASVLHREMDELTLPPEFHRRVLNAIRDQSQPSRPAKLPGGWWPKFAWATAVGTALIIAACLMTESLFRSNTARQGDGRVQASNPATSVSIQLSYCAPAYTFRQEGDLVIDCLICTPRVVEQSLWLYRNLETTKTRL